jgi:hypothetical protein
MSRRQYGRGQRPLEQPEFLRYGGCCERRQGEGADDREYRCGHFSVPVGERKRAMFRDGAELWPEVGDGVTG